MGVVQSRHGSGTYIPDGPPTLGSEPLSFLAALHGFTREEMYETRRILEVGAAGLAAERATADQLAALAEEVASLFASMEDPLRFLVHDINFHRTVAAASGNPIVASLVEMVSTLYYERRRRTAERASDRDLRDAAEMHRRIYQAIRSRDADAARKAMHEHLMQAAAHQSKESAQEEAAARASLPPPAPSRPAARRRPKRARGTN
jgi:GntR family transcriptional repressor for pyruvate dehydrogenase complex